MLLVVTFLTLLTTIPYGTAMSRSCVPNTQFLLNGKLCTCNSMGQSNDASCHVIGRRQSCQPGQIIWEECSQCICQENRKLLCTNTECNEDVIKSRAAARSGAAIWCTPYKPYYVNCTLCVCPASGKMSEARCAKDSSCNLKGSYTSLDRLPQTICIPKVMYLFSCLHCLCSDEGQFVKNKCIETCHKASESGQLCIPNGFYKNGCNICRCSDNGSKDNNVCSKSTCAQNLKLTSLTLLRNKTTACVPNKYTKPKCIYCECNTHGSINEQACMEQECLKVEDYNYETIKATCSPGEMVPTCMQCFCPRSKLIIEKYCTRVCSPQNRLAVVEAMLKDKVSLIDRNTVKETTGTDSCDPNSLFLDQGRYCLCSDNGNTNFKQCTSVLEDTIPKKPSKVFVQGGMSDARNIDFNITCEPHTYIEFGCNSCYCSKHGKLDPKWCTNDDCEAKKVIAAKTKSRLGPIVITHGATCVPGSVTKSDCNFCICGSSGLLADKVCTKNSCNNLKKLPVEELHCDPASYYTVDCNMCYCPSDGIKNVEKCTKNLCEVNFLRSNSCTPGQLFSSDCNICVCPPSGEKKHKICTNRTCFENDAPWKKIFKISQNVIGNHLVEGKARNFEHCFPGEEFEMGCKVCVCPDMGLKEYASCNAILCDPQTTDVADSFKEDRLRRDYGNSNATDARRKSKRKHKHKHYLSSESKEDDDHTHDMDEHCKYYNLTDSAETKECTPGSEYIIRCQVCICPYMGSISLFCRPMPEERYCEQAYPGFNYLPMGRRHVEMVNGTTKIPITSSKPQYPITIYMPHNHTKYKCDVEGRIEEECFICDCKNKVVIAEHCYKNDHENCANVTTPKCITEKNRLYPRDLLSQ